VARAGLGTLNHTALTLEALDRRHLPAALVIGSWPATPDLVHWRNLVDLPGELAGVLPEGAGSWPGERFRAAAPGWLTSRLYGTADPDRLRADGVPIG
jgi:dethiobiotin synthetase